MAGFMPPPPQDQTLPVKWQSFPFSVDNEAKILTYTFEMCPAYFKRANENMAKLEMDETIRKWMIEDKDILRRVGDFLGKPLTTYSEVMHAAEHIRTIQYIDPTVPSWVVNSMSQLLRYQVKVFESYVVDQFLQKVRVGPLITEIVDDMLLKAKNSSAGHNVLIYSAHDLNLFAMSKMLAISNQVPQIPAYGDAYAIEMHQSGNKEPELQVYYMSSSIANLKFKIRMIIPGCGSSCPLNTFARIINPFVVRDWNALCTV